MPTSSTNLKDSITAVFTELAPRYEETVDSELHKLWGWGYHDFISALVEEIPRSDGDRILDVATGTAVIPLAIAANGRKRLHINGLDITPAMLVRAQEKMAAKRLHSNISLVCASAMQLPYADSRFDGVVSALATHHLDIDQSLAEIHRVLREGGCFTLGDVGASTVWKVPGVRLVIRILALVYFTIYENFSRAWAEIVAVPNVLTIRDWQKKLERSGFKRVTVKRLGSRRYWASHPIIIKAYK